MDYFGGVTANHNNNNMLICLANTHQNGNHATPFPNSDSSSSNWDSNHHHHINNTSSSSSSAVNRHGVMLLPPGRLNDDGVLRHQAPYVGDGSHVHPDPHLMCLKLGKRHYFEDSSSVGGSSSSIAAGLGLVDKRGKGGYCGVKGTGGVQLTTVPRCQVEGCEVALGNAKEYHRRHKVCEMHSKAPKVVVLGMEQRFCQQCSRFHVVSEFDDSKRSCRRRLAGHNERRRKSSHDSVARNSSQGGCALSLLSPRSDSWLSPADLSIRCSAALRELIAENRAAVMARQFVSDRDWHFLHHAVEDFKEIQPEYNYFPEHMFPQTQ